jgi:discoidin domain receptor family protein 2
MRSGKSRILAFTQLPTARECVYGMTMFPRLIASLLAPAALFGAGLLYPVSYSAPNGTLGPSGLLYRDDLYAGTGDRHADGATLSGGLGQLTDGMTGCGNDPRKDCGKGPGRDWVGWREDPTLVFDFGRRCDFSMIRIFTANFPQADAALWDTATVSFSDDGLEWHGGVLATTTAAEKTDHTARFIDIPVNGSGRLVRIHLVRARPSTWLLVSEFQFEGRTAEHQASPTTR